MQSYWRLNELLISYKLLVHTLCQKAKCDYGSNLWIDARNGAIYA